MCPYLSLPPQPVSVADPGGHDPSKNLSLCYSCLNAINIVMECTVDMNDMYDQSL